MVKKNACVFISGTGSNLRNLILKSREYNFPIKIKLVVCDNKKAKGIIYAKRNSIPFLIINSKSRSYENRVLVILKKYKINFICLAGYMRVISKNFLNNFRNKIINIHPSLLPKFKGLNTYKRILRNKEKKTGCTVHFVNERLDSGTIIIKKSFFINPSDSEIVIKNKTQNLEKKAFPEAVFKIFRNY